MLQQVVVDRGLQVIDAGVTAAPDAFGRDLGEEPFDHVQSRGAGRREMQLEAWVFVRLGADLGGFVSGVVVEHEMHLARLRHGPVDPAQKP